MNPGDTAIFTISSKQKRFFRLGKRAGFLLVGILLLGFGLWWLLLRESPHEYRALSLSDRGWVLPVLTGNLRGTPGDWALRAPSGRVLVRGRGGVVRQASDYLGSACGLSSGTPARWHWQPHTGHRKVLIVLGSCEIDLLREPHPQR